MVIPVCYPYLSKFGDTIEPYAKVPVASVLGRVVAHLEEAKRVPAIFGDKLIADGEM